MDRSAQAVDDGSLRSRGKGVLVIGLLLNVVAVLLSLRFVLHAPRTALFLPFDGVALLGLAICGISIIVLVSSMAMREKKIRLSSVLGVILSLTPLPLYVAIFALINHVKDFVFW